MLTMGCSRTTHCAGQLTFRAERSRTRVNELRKPRGDLLQNLGVAFRIIEEDPGTVAATLGLQTGGHAALTNNMEELAHLNTASDQRIPSDRNIGDN